MYTVLWLKEELIWIFVHRQVPGCHAAQRPRPPSAFKWPGVDHAHKDDAARAAKSKDLSGLLPPWAAVCLLPRTHNPLHLCQHPHLLVGSFMDSGKHSAVYSLNRSLVICSTGPAPSTSYAEC